jgi:chromate transporter
MSTPTRIAPATVDARAGARVPLRKILRQWVRIGCIGFGGPPAHISLLRELCVARRGWLNKREFEDAIAACNLLPGPSSTQLAIFCAWRVAGPLGALLGGVAFILPGLVLIVLLAVVFLAASPPVWVRGAGAGAGAAVAAVAVRAGVGLLPASWRRAQDHLRWSLYALLGGAAAAVLGPWLVLVLLACGALEMLWRRGGGGTGRLSAHAWPLIGVVGMAGGGLLALIWVALKVGTLAYGGGFVIVPLMQAEAVGHYHWMSSAQFLNAVALGQVTPGPLVQSVAVVGYAAAGVGGALLAAMVAFAPSFIFITLGASHFDRLRASPRVQAFLDGASPAALGAILGSALPLATALHTTWQVGVLALAALALLAFRRGVVSVLLAAGALGAILGLAGAPLPAA